MKRLTSLGLIEVVNIVQIYLKNFCDENGIIHETSILYTPQQNGIVERKNRILKEIMNYVIKF